MKINSYQLSKVKSEKLSIFYTIIVLIHKETIHRKHLPKKFEIDAILKMIEQDVSQQMKFQGIFHLIPCDGNSFTGHHYEVSQGRTDSADTFLTTNSMETE
jgi:hypothetical protein